VRHVYKRRQDSATAKTTALIPRNCFNDKDQTYLELRSGDWAKSAIYDCLVDVAVSRVAIGI